MSACVKAGLLYDYVKKEEIKMRTGYWVGMFVACAIMVEAETVPAVPYSFNYQGVLRGGSGEQLLPPLQKTVDFRLYASASGGTALWGRNYAILLDTNGLFNVELSDSGAPLSQGPINSSLSSVIAGSQTLYLGLTVNGTGALEIAPRQQLLSVPYAMMAGDVKSASGDFKVTGTLNVGNTHLSSPTTGTLEVPSLSVTGQATMNQSLCVSGATTVSNLTVNGTATLNNATTMSNLTVRGTTTLNGPSSLFSTGNTLEDTWITMTDADLPLLAAAKSDGFIIINFNYYLDTDSTDYNKIIHKIHFYGGTTTRDFYHGAFYDNVEAYRISRYDSVTMPVLKGESVMLKKHIWSINSETKVYVRCLFVRFGVNQ